jgi:hypothetical protein
LILADALFYLIEEGEEKEKKTKKKRREKNTMVEDSFPELDPPCWLCHGLQLLGVIKG